LLTLNKYVPSCNLTICLIVTLVASKG